MNPRNLLLILTACLETCASTAQTAETPTAFYQPLLLASVDAPLPEANSAGAQTAQQAALAQKLQNPVADLITAPIQNNWDIGIGPANAMRYTANVQPVVPLSISKDWLLVTRTILPVIYAQSPVEGGRDHWGLGDTLQSFFVSPKAGVGGFTVGVGPALLYPSATDSALGSGKWGAGPTGVLVRQQGGWTVGLLANHVWSYAGWGEADVSSTFVEPFASYTTKTFTTLGVSSESTYDWQARQWTVPVNVTLSQLVKIGKLPVQFGLGPRFYAEGPSDGPDWGLRFTITFLLPKGAGHHENQQAHP